MRPLPLRRLCFVIALAIALGVAARPGWAGDDGEPDHSVLPLGDEAAAGDGDKKARLGCVRVVDPIEDHGATRRRPPALDAPLHRDVLTVAPKTSPPIERA